MSKDSSKLEMLEYDSSNILCESILFKNKV